MQVKKPNDYSHESSQRLTTSLRSSMISNQGLHSQDGRTVSQLNEGSLNSRMMRTLNNSTLNDRSRYRTPILKPNQVDRQIHIKLKMPSNQFYLSNPLTQQNQLGFLQQYGTGPQMTPDQSTNNYLVSGMTSTFQQDPQFTGGYFAAGQGLQTDQSFQNPHLTLNFQRLKDIQNQTNQGRSKEQPFQNHQFPFQVKKQSLPHQEMNHQSTQNIYQQRSNVEQNDNQDNYERGSSMHNYQQQQQQQFPQQNLQQSPFQTSFTQLDSVILPKSRILKASHHRTGSTLIKRQVDNINLGERGSNQRGVRKINFNMMQPHSTISAIVSRDGSPVSLQTPQGGYPYQDSELSSSFNPSQLQIINESSQFNEAARQQQPYGKYVLQGPQLWQQTLIGEDASMMTNFRTVEGSAPQRGNRSITVMKKRAGRRIGMPHTPNPESSTRENQVYMTQNPYQHSQSPYSQAQVSMLPQVNNNLGNFQQEYESSMHQTLKTPKSQLVSEDTTTSYKQNQSSNPTPLHHFQPSASPYSQRRPQKSKRFQGFTSSTPPRERVQEAERAAQQLSNSIAQTFYQANKKLKEQWQNEQMQFQNQLQQHRMNLNVQLINQQIITFKNRQMF